MANLSNLTPTQERLYEFARAQFIALKHIHTEAHIQGMLIPTCQRREYDLPLTYVAHTRRKDEKAHAT